MNAMDRYPLPSRRGGPTEPVFRAGRSAATGGTHPARRPFDIVRLRWANDRAVRSTPASRLRAPEATGLYPPSAPPSTHRIAATHPASTRPRKAWGRMRSVIA